MRDMKVSLAEEADKRLNSIETEEYTHVMDKANESHEVDALKKENEALVSIVGQLSGQINTLTASFNKFSTNVEANLVLMNNRIKAAENNISEKKIYSPEQDKAF